jgi:hypothetical protein
MEIVCIFILYGSHLSTWQLAAGFLVTGRVVTRGGKVENNITTSDRNVKIEKTWHTCPPTPTR